MKHNTIVLCIKAIEDVLNVHENHLFPIDLEALNKAKEQLEKMKEQGFK